ncbi:hypothetical protein CMK18_20420 [Candidatus Poribacteria bacterium]|nr:hypothetical protein [Candidatus Poribacteria bacterium]
MIKDLLWRFSAIFMANENMIKRTMVKTCISQILLNYNKPDLNFINSKGIVSTENHCIVQLYHSQYEEDETHSSTSHLNLVNSIWAKAAT